MYHKKVAFSKKLKKSSSSASEKGGQFSSFSNFFFQNFWLSTKILMSKLYLKSRKSKKKSSSEFKFLWLNNSVFWYVIVCSEGPQIFIIQCSEFFCLKSFAGFSHVQFQVGHTHSWKDIKRRKFSQILKIFKKRFFLIHHLTPWRN